MKRHVLASLFLITIILISCNSKSNKADAIGAQQLQISEPFDITYSESGGVTGLVESYHIASSGVVEHFQKMPGQQDSLVWSKEVPIGTLAQLQQSLVSSDILSQSMNEKGNMTSRMTYTTSDTSYALSWPGVGATADVSPDLQNWVLQLKSLLKH